MRGWVWLLPLAPSFSQKWEEIKNLEMITSLTLINYAIIKKKGNNTVINHESKVISECHEEWAHHVSCHHWTAALRRQHANTFRICGMFILPAFLALIILWVTQHRQVDHRQPMRSMCVSLIMYSHVSCISHNGQSLLIPQNSCYLFWFTYYTRICLQ